MLGFSDEGGVVALIPFAWIAAPDFEAETTHGKIKVRSEACEVWIGADTFGCLVPRLGWRYVEKTRGFDFEAFPAAV
jgi:hypothetical protein